MPVTRDVLESIHQRRGGPNPGSDLFATIDPFTRTAAETTAGITPTNYSYAPGDVRRYGFVGDNVHDDQPPIQTAVTVAANAAQKAIYIPATPPGFKLGSTVTVTSACRIFGDNSFNTVANLTGDFPAFTVASQNVVIEHLGIIGTNAGGNLKAGVEYTKSIYCILRDVLISKCGWAVRYFPGTGSSYLNTIQDSQLGGNIVGNIRGDANTNFLQLRNVVFGSAPVGFQIVDSTSPQIYGGDCEGCTIISVDIDATSDSHIGALIMGVDFEGSRASAGDIRIGNTANVRGVTVIGGFLSPISAAYFINPIRCDSLTLIGVAQVGGYGTSTWINQTGTLTNLVVIGAEQTAQSQLITGALGFSGGNSGRGPSALANSFAQSRAVLTYTTGVGMTMNAAANNSYELTINDGAAWTINAPSNPIVGARLKLTVNNSSGGGLGAATFNVIFKMAAWVSPGANFRRSIEWEYNAANWIEINRNTTDIPT